MHLSYAEMLSFSVELRQKLIYNAYTVFGFELIELEEGEVLWRNLRSWSVVRPKVWF